MTLNTPSVCRQQDDTGKNAAEIQEDVSKVSVKQFNT